MGIIKRKNYLPWQIVQRYFFFSERVYTLPLHICMDIVCIARVSVLLDNESVLRCVNEGNEIIFAVILL